MKAIQKVYKRKVNLPKVKGSGLLSDLPIIGDIFSSIFGSGFNVGDFVKGIAQKVTKKNIIRAKEFLDKHKILEIMEKAKVYFSLLWKAKEKKIKVNDKEIIEWVNRNFTRGGKFDEASYTRYINHISRAFNISLTPRSFEEYIRELIVMDKLWKEVVHVTVTDEEARRLHEIDTQEAKIAYLFIPYQKFRVDIGISPKEIEEYYKNNKSLFKREAKINIKYALIDQGSQLNDQELSELSKLKTLNDLREYLSKKEKTSLEIKETGFIGLDDPVNEIGWHPAITQKAFSLAVNQISEPIKLEKGLIIVGKEEEKPAIIPALGEIKGEVKEALIVIRAKEEAKKFTQEILNEISKKEVKDLSKAASHIDGAGKENIEFKETEYFKYNDYIEGIGLNRMVSTIAFALKKDEIYSKIIPLEKGAYILQLKDKTLFDEESFEAKKQTYRDNIKAQKEFIERLKFLESLAREIDIKIPLSKQNPLSG